jgi:hypothetical protein
VTTQSYIEPSYPLVDLIARDQVDQDESRDPPEHRSSPLRDPIDMYIRNVPPRGSTVACAATEPKVPWSRVRS